MGHAAYYSVIQLANKQDILSWLGDPSPRPVGVKHHSPRPSSHPYLTKH